MKLRATIRVRNDALLLARKTRGWTQSYLATMAEIPIGLIQALERLDYTRRDTRQGADRLSWTLEIPLEDILPEDLVGLDLQVKEVFIQDVSPKQLINAMSPQKYLQPPDEVVAEHEALDIALKLLDDRLRLAIEIRYGLKGNKPHTFDECGEVLGVTRERARQIVCRAEREFKETYPTLDENYFKEES